MRVGYGFINKKQEESAEIFKFMALNSEFFPRTREIYLEYFSDTRDGKDFLERASYPHHDFWP
jgi:hypothetical protein